MVFKNRQEAGMRLAEKLVQYKDTRAVVCALPRGGVPVGYEVAHILTMPLDTIVVRKLGVPMNPEFGFGAIGDGDVRVIDEEVVEMIGMDQSTIESITQREREELERRKGVYNSGEYIEGKDFETGIIVDDGLATGVTMRAAVAVARTLYNPVKIVVAVPVSALSSSASVRGMVDEFVTLHDANNLGAIGMFYEEFDQTTDEQVCDLLTKANNPE